MPRVEVGYNPGAEALQTTASPNIQAVQARMDPNASKAFQLASMFAKAQPVVERMMEDQDRKRMQEQILKEGFYKEQFAKDHQSGAVTASQVGQRFPETVPIVRARVAEGVGQEHGKTAVQGVIDEINNNADLINDSAKRDAFIKQKKAELLAGAAKADPSNEFYLSGYSSSIDRELNQWQNGWQRKSAEFYKETQAKDFGNKVVDAMSAPNPKEALEKLDTEWKASSSLNNIERNKLVVDTFTKQAFGSLTPEILDRIPDRFLNAETKAQVQQVKLQIQEARMSTIRNAQTLTNYQREEETRNAKLQMIQDVAAGKQVNPAMYRTNPDAFNFALTMKDTGAVSDAVTQANLQRERSKILSTSTVGDLDQNKAIDGILARKDINPKEKADLIKEIPKLIEGTIAMNDEMVKSVYSTRIGPQLEALEKSANQRIQSITTGTNLRGNAVKLFDNEIRTRFSDYYEENGKWPTGRAKREIIDSAVDNAEKFIQQQVKIGGATEAGTQPAPQATPAAKPASKPAAKPQPTQADIDFVKKNPQFKQKFIDQFGREP